MGSKILLVLTRPLPPHPHVLSSPMASLRNYRVPLYNNSTMPNPEQGKRSTTTPHNDEKWPPILRRRYRFLFHRRPIADEPHGLGRSFAALLLGLRPALPPPDLRSARWARTDLGSRRFAFQGQSLSLSLSLSLSIFSWILVIIWHLVAEKLRRWVWCCIWFGSFWKILSVLFVTVLRLPFSLLNFYSDVVFGCRESDGK